MKLLMKKYIYKSVREKEAVILVMMKKLTYFMWKHGKATKTLD